MGGKNEMGAPDFRAPAAGFEFENAPGFCKKPTAPCVPRRSPIQVLTGLNAA